VGSNPNSRIFYNRVKGETEAALSKLPYQAIHFFRPSLLLGERKGSRRAEKAGIGAMKVASVLLAGPLRKYKPIEAETVARAMILAAGKMQTGISIYESDEIQSLVHTPI
jgi:uncharacterized protein YbjT (DUF2867 family)